MKRTRILVEREKQETRKSADFNPQAEHAGSKSIADTAKELIDGVTHSLQFSDSAITLGPFLRLLLTLPVRQEASAADVSDLSRMGVRNDALAGRYMTVVCTTEQAADGGRDRRVFRLVSLEK